MKNSPHITHSLRPPKWSDVSSRINKNKTANITACQLLCLSSPPTTHLIKKGIITSPVTNEETECQRVEDKLALDPTADKWQNQNMHTTLINSKYIFSSVHYLNSYLMQDKRYKLGW